MISSQNKIIAGIVLVVLILGGCFAYYSTRAPGIPSRASLDGKPELQVAYDKALAAEKAIPSDKTNPLQYVIASSEWKTIGDFTNNPVWYRRALSVLQEGITATKGTNSLLITNAAVIATISGDFETARALYEQAIADAPGDGSYYTALAHLLSGKMHASQADVLKIYTRAIERVIGGADIIQDRALYFKSVGRYDDALKDYEQLKNSNIISAEKYADVLVEIKQLESSQPR